MNPNLIGLMDHLNLKIQGRRGELARFLAESKRQKSQR